VLSLLSLTIGAVAKGGRTCGENTTKAVPDLSGTAFVLSG
jgi:hypothetical protein